MNHCILFFPTAVVYRLCIALVWTCSGQCGDKSSKLLFWRLVCLFSFCSLVFVQLQLERLVAQLTFVKNVFGGACFIANRTEALHLKLRKKLCTLHLLLGLQNIQDHYTEMNAEVKLPCLSKGRHNDDRYRKTSITFQFQFIWLCNIAFCSYVICLSIFNFFLHEELFESTCLSEIRLTGMKIEVPHEILSLN